MKALIPTRSVLNKATTVLQEYFFIKWLIKTDISQTIEIKPNNNFRSTDIIRINFLDILQQNFYPVSEKQK